MKYSWRRLEEAFWLGRIAGCVQKLAGLDDAVAPLFTLLFGLIWGHRNAALEWAGILLSLVGISLLNMGSNLQALSRCRRNRCRNLSLLANHGGRKAGYFER
ncbi:hypothetical protein BKM14_11185 [Pseudomonas syringae pv. syringae]|uniref:hypothetical protein n=1 Tax=Pseudomonas syringae TaxID=317 RepID=UPI000D4770F0|nr:hypothetical protein BKM14_11185 [Pseudomonas syringae pv. syringae]POD55143.1 hypothetical protein BKM15_08450 [Pseudomonas syringae pv. syringae]